MDNHCTETLYAKMETRYRGQIRPTTPKDKIRINKQQLRNIAISSAAVFCLGIGAIELMNGGAKTTEVMSHITTDFEYDETLGRLQFVSNILPESAMVFMQDHEDPADVFSPSGSEIIHAWSQKEPWLEYASGGDITACSDGEVMTVIKNRDGEYTVRLLHDDGYESVYSGLTNLSVAQFDRLLAGDIIGQSVGNTAFEWRKDGLSVMPTFEQPSYQGYDT